MSSLRNLQTGFAAAILADPGTAPPFRTVPPDEAAARIGVYRNGVFANYRKALGASYPVVARLVGTDFFAFAVDAFVHTRPSVYGDLNVYGNEFGAFLAQFEPAAGLPYLSGVATLEWAIDESGRAAEPPACADVIAALTALAPERQPHARMAFDPSVRIVASPYPVLRIWQANQPGHDGGGVTLDDGGCAVLVRRRSDSVTIEPIDPGEASWLAAMLGGATLEAALAAAEAAEVEFDLGAALRTHAGNGVLVGVHG